jgi:HEAT repeat protein
VRCHCLCLLVALSLSACRPIPQPAPSREETSGTEAPATPGAPPEGPEEPNPPTEDIGPLIKALRGSHDRPKVKAAEKLGRMGRKAVPATEALCQAAGDESAHVRDAALSALETVAPRLHKHVAALVIDENPANCLAAVKALAAMGQDARPAAGLVAAQTGKLLDRTETPAGSFDAPTERLLSAEVACLATLAPEDPAARAVIARCLRYTPGYDVRPAAVAALRAVGKAHPAARKEVVGELLKAVDARRHGKPDQRTSLLAVKALAAFGPDARAAAPALRKLKLNPSEEVRGAASEALRKIDPPSRDQ